MIDPSGTTRFTLPPGRAPGASREDELARAVRALAAGHYAMLGPLGRGRFGSIVHLARDVATQRLVALRLDEARDAADAFELTVVEQLDERIPAPGASCPACQRPLDGWGRFCPRCGGDVAGADAAAPDGATADSHEVLGEMVRVHGGGRVAFARARATGVLVALPPGSAVPSGGETGALTSGGTQPVLEPRVEAMGVVPPAPSREEAIALPTPSVAAVGESMLPGSAPASGRRRRTGGLVVGGVVVAAVAGGLALVRGGADSPRTSVPPAAVAESGRASPQASVGGDRVPAVPDASTAPGASGAAAADSAVLVIGGPLPAGARVLVDGHVARGRTVALARGRHTVVVRAPGYEPHTEELHLTADSTAWTPALRAAAPSPTCARAAAAQSWERARTLCANEARVGAPAAQRQYGILLLRGLGGAPDESAAVELLRQAAAGEDAEAQYELARVHQTRARYRDDRKAYELFRRAAEQGFVDAQLETGRALERGLGTGRDLREAYRWYERAALAGYPPAQNAYGIFLKKGLGTARDDQKALEWLTKAAQGGSADAHFHVGELHEQGRAGLARSTEQALEWYRKGAALGSEEAKRALKRLQ